MSHETRRRTLITIAGTMLACSPVLAQVAPPPAEQPEQDETYVAPEKPAQTGVTVRSQQAGQQAQPQTPQRRRVAPPNIPFRSLVVLDENDQIIRITRPVALMALANNPTIAENARERVLPVVYDRHVRQEERLLQNLDLYLGFEFGMHREMDLGDLQALSRLTRQIKPLTEPGDIGTDLEDAGVFSASQRALNNLIVQDYKKALSNEIKLESGNELAPLFEQIIEDALIEPRYTYGLMVKELAGRGTEVISNAGLDDAEGIDAVRELLEGGWPEDYDEQSRVIGDLKAALSNMSLEDHEKLIRASRQMREDPSVPPIPEVKLVPEGSGMQGNDKAPMTLNLKNFNEDGTIRHQHTVGGATKDRKEQEDESSDSDG